MSSYPRPKIKSSLPKRATPETKFYIDYDWWEKSHLDLKTYVLNRLSLGEDFITDSEVDKVDLVDARTGEVHQVDGFQYVVQTYFNRLPEDFVTHASLVDAAFSVLLANANQPMTAREIAERIRRPPEVVVRTLGGPKIYQGIRPIFDDE